MNSNQRGIITAVVHGDLALATQYAKMIVSNDTTQANRQFCESIKRRLEYQSSLVELPQDVKGILIMEDVSVSFNKNRYFLSDRESAIADEVLKMYQTGQKLSDMGIRYLNSLMLYGESGTGKTLFGRYLAYKLGLPFVYMNFSNAISSYLGSTGKNIQKAFEFVQKQKCVFMLDEVDAIGMKRGKEDVGEMSRIVIGLMQALDRVGNDTVVVGATNRIDVIDSALLRRFTVKHKVERFSTDELYGMVIQFLDDVKVPYAGFDVRQYCEKKPVQAQATNDVVRAIAESIQNQTPFRLVK